MSESLGQLLDPYGPPAQVIDLRRPTPEGISYVDLLAAERSGLPDGIVESRAEPLAYVVDAVNRETTIDLPRLWKTVALRGDAPYLVVVQPGQLLAYETSPKKQKMPVPFDQILHNEDRARTVFARLNAALGSSEKTGRFMHDVLFNLLSQTIEDLSPSLGRHDAISLAGRALFLRFLIDRDIVVAERAKEICSKAGSLNDLFAGSERTFATCEWLNRTFNGDFLPLEFLDTPGKSIPGNVFGPLEDIMHRTPGSQLTFEWASIDFAHVPVGLLSQVYERQAEWDPGAKKRQSVYYTPRRIADFMVKEVFAALEKRGPVNPHEARVLDPAVGGGVFLVSAFQEIVAAWWRYHGHAPNTDQIRSILYRQLVGFDISAPTLQLTALSLYLKAIELDLDPHPPEKLKFRALMGTVLHSMRRPGEEKSDVVLGSLGPRAGSAFRNRFDIVVGNPPWTPLGKKQGGLHREMVDAVRPIVAEKLGPKHAVSFTVPDLVPDLPFVWRSLEWTKPSGWIALALHGRLLFKMSVGGRQAREDLFRASEVTGILNGADLRKTLVWPNVTAPFCLLFARNQLPAEDHAFHFVSPYLEERLNRQGRLRVDAKAAYPVGVRRILARPNLLKTIFRGSALDVALVEKLDSEGWSTVEEYFCQHGLKAGQGFQVGTRERDVPSELQGKPELRAAWEGAVHIESQRLPRFREKRLQWPRDPLIYRGPLALVRKSPTKGERSLCCFDDLVYCESYYGYSAFGHPEGKLLVRYLTLLIQSDFFLWYVLVTSSEFGVERDAIHKIEVDSFPFRPLEDLPEDLRREIEPLSESFFLNEPNLQKELTDWSARVYGLNRWDQEVIRDTLCVSLPFSVAKSNAQRPPNRTEMEQFANRLTRELSPLGLSVQRVSESPTSAPWEVLALTIMGETGYPELAAIDELFRVADEEGASQILVVQPDQRRLLLGILREYRYWTPSRARLAALEILHENLGKFQRVS